MSSVSFLSFVYTQAPSSTPFFGKSPMESDADALLGLWVPEVFALLWSLLSPPLADS